ncbi:MAG: hypothetical protein QNJ67_02330 [Kiloniellales bacterium]|nr:hypothetical protein [Kiloniellales bacterium]
MMNFDLSSLRSLALSFVFGGFLALVALASSLVASSLTAWFALETDSISQWVLSCVTIVSMFYAMTWMLKAMGPLLKRHGGSRTGELGFLQTLVAALTMVSLLFLVERQLDLGWSEDQWLFWLLLPILLFLPGYESFEAALVRRDENEERS